MLLVMKKVKIKLSARQPPQRNGVSLMAKTPDRERNGINTNPNNRINPIDFARAQCFPKMYWQRGVLLFRVEKPTSAPKNAPVKIVTDMAVLLRGSHL
jgi:hypothetical protein